MELEPKKPSAQILRHEIQEGRIAIRRPVGGLFLSGLSAGLDIGFSLFLIAVTKTQVDGVLPRPVVALLLANMYAVGFIFVVLGRSELFYPGRRTRGGRSDFLTTGADGRWGRTPN